ncbi:glycosyltransferase family 2 protein [Roseivivax isoporae]|uniref:Glycosyltransferase 2-like domain-containing protein n=1 Tax=Roseivivax isoporae LMG 25204 TaxID=1449351 RepID=X7FB95_9RHOB|nr:glycosyltransferase family 2 protein [Roseivivax isoporae]ETX30030.1 hypothetical protein RISW2_20120 [Roseivivax isoporae LMG 25204]
MRSLFRAGADRSDRNATPVVALAHNEANILREFLAHYRSICRPSFFIVDDRSDDGTAEILAGEPDVTVFHPVLGSDYRQHQATWRNEILDAYGDGLWCLVPDIDEHFVWPDAEDRPFADYCDALADEGAEAVVTLMVDMYADAGLRDHVFDAGLGHSLREAFPYFDGPAPAPHGYFMRRLRRRALSQYATPPVRLLGGMRARLFDGIDVPSPIASFLLERLHRLDRPIHAALPERAAERLAWRLTKHTLKGQATKVGLLRWRRGLSFNAGPHKVDGHLPVSESIAAFLHYRFTRGIGGVEYALARGNHHDGSRAYREVLERAELMARSPVWTYSRRYWSSRSLDGLIRDIPAARS